MQQMIYNNLYDIMLAQWKDFPAEWLSNESIDQIQQLCFQLPPVSGFGIELDCGHPNGEADISVRLQRCDAGAQAFLNSTEEGTVPDGFLANSHWQAIHRFAAFWRAHPLTSGGHLPAAWLEFDAAEWRKLIPSPCLFVGIWNIDKDRLHETHLIPDLHRALTRSDLPAPWHRTLRRVLDWGPGTIERCWVGYMLSRPDTGIRFTTMLSVKDLRRIFLEHWDTIPEEFETLFETGVFNSNHSTRYMTHFDCAETLGPRIGIEVVPETLERQFHLVRCGFITVEELQRIYRWCKHSHKTMEDVNPESLSQLPIQGSEMSWVRQLGHYKIDFVNGFYHKTKAYLGISHTWK